MNEDSYLIWQVGAQCEINEQSAVPELADISSDEPLGLFLIADGVGGAAAGEVASRQAVEMIAHQIAATLSASPPAPGRDWGPYIEAAVEHADRGVYALREQAGNDMSTTLVGALIVGSTAYVVNIGDSRAYVIDPNQIRRISHDHSYVQFLVDSHEIKQEAVRSHPQRNIILRSLGSQGDGEVDLFPTELAAGQTLLLCSDGLWEMVEDRDVQKIINNATNLQQAADALVEAANKNGGADNISLILVKLADKEDSTLT